MIEDLHWADAATPELIRYLARRGEDSPALLLLTFRDDEVGACHPVRVCSSVSSRPSDGSAASACGR